jgi:hypothetical protein
MRLARAKYKEDVQESLADKLRALLEECLMPAMEEHLSDEVVKGLTDPAVQCFLQDAVPKLLKVYEYYGARNLARGDVDDSPELCLAEFMEMMKVRQ